MFNRVLDYQSKVKLNNFAPLCQSIRGFGTVHFSLLLTTVPTKSSTVCNEDFHGKVFHN